MIAKKISTFIILFTTFFTALAQEKFTLSGTITDQNSNETLIGVNIVVLFFNLNEIFFVGFI
ncbi:hypothetical protein HNP37_004043 [Flavobacterium nitrogenifigens]|uniref:CarboxypepD_reg-like domain-containing protein n=2 Tax=Flavobacterium TaxID=237 RepID=A0A7W7J0K6_9FLAO|nr:hypothetical protein [Flavobacterium nitrogenifigens]MBB6388885.1 hypothetical protein [Flavobacterium notoginsengisoli]